MTPTHPTQVPGDKLKRALAMLAELVEQHPEKPRGALLREIELKLDLSPLECEFLNKHFDESQDAASNPTRH
jgi:hypothetical protein